MSTSRSTLTNPSRRLPHLRLPAVDSGAEVPLIWRRTGPILLFLHRRDCSVCRAYANEVAVAIDEISEWDGRPLIILPEDADRSMQRAGGSQIPILEDRRQRLTESLSITAPAIVIADQWGEIYERHEAGEGHDFRTPDELVGWARTLATKCPECEGEAF